MNIVLGIFLGLVLALGIHQLAWYLRLNSPGGAALAGLGGAAVFATASGLFLGPYTGEIGRPVLIGTLIVVGVAIVLGFYQSLSFHAPAWIAVLAVFIEIGLALLIALFLTLVRDAWLSLAEGGSVFPGPGADAWVNNFHQSALISMVLFTLVLGLLRPAFRISGGKHKRVKGPLAR